jgi:hypothetical protein
LNQAIIFSMHRDPTEHLPLLPAGFHEMTMADLRALCVAAKRFENSVSRVPIMTSLERRIESLVGHGIPGEVWVNGSFLTEKIDPEDVDITVRLDGTFYDQATVQQRNALRRIMETTGSERIDGYLQLEWPVGHPYYALGVENYEYWRKQWGISRQGFAKGIAVLKLLRG